MFPAHLAVVVSEYEGGPVLRPGEAGNGRARLLPHQLRLLRPAGLQRPQVGLPAVISAQFHVSVGQARLGISDVPDAVINVGSACLK